MKLSRAVYLIILCLSLTLLLSTSALAGTCTGNVGIYVDGNSSDLNNISGAVVGAGCTATVLTSLSSLAGYDAVIVSRYDSSFGVGLSGSDAATVMTYAGGRYGNAYLFLNDWFDNLSGASSGDPYDPNVQMLLENIITAAAATHHGYIGEFNGGVEGLIGNSNGFPALGFVLGTAGPLGGISCLSVTQVHAYGVGVGSFTPTDGTCFGAASTVPFGDVIYEYSDGTPAVVTNATPEPATMLLLGSGLISALAYGRRRLGL